MPTERKRSSSPFVWPALNYVLLPLVGAVSSRYVKITIVTQTVEVLVLDLLEWLTRKDRSYAETMEVWRTSCPKLPVWEDAMDRGLVCVENGNGQLSVRITSIGVELLNKMRPRDEVEGFHPR